MLLQNSTALSCGEKIKYLEIAPGKNQIPTSLIYDKCAEKLPFLNIYLGKPRKFLIDNITPYMMALNEIHRADRHGIKPKHALHMARKIMRLLHTEDLYVTFTNRVNTKNLS